MKFIETLNNENISCVICKKEFESRSNKLFCSRVCKEKNRRKPWIKHRKMFCEECKFIPVHISQLEVDHIDGDKENNDVSNLKTLCANCHRLKSVTNGDCKNLKFRKSNK